MSRPSAIDYLGPHGGELAMAFAAGCVLTFGFVVVLGKWLWSIIGKVKDDQIAALKIQATHDAASCAAMEARLVQRIQTLEGFILSIAPPTRRPAMERTLAEQKVLAAETLEEGDG